MNEEYLRGLHKHIGITDDYDTWINSVKDNEEYLSGLHKNIGITDDYDTWKSSVFGDGSKKTKDEGGELSFLRGKNILDELSGEKEVIDDKKTQKTPSSKIDVISERNERISKLEKEVGNWTPEEGVNYDDLPMVDLRKTKNLDFKELNRLKKEEKGPDSSVDVPFSLEQQVIQQNKNWNRMKEGEVPLDRWGVPEYKGSKNKLSYREFDGLGEDEAIKKIKEKYPHLKLNVPFKPGDDIIEITGLSGDLTLDLNTDWNEGQSQEKGIQVYSELINFLDKEEQAYEANPAYKYINDQTYGRLELEAGEYNIYKTPPTFNVGESLTALTTFGAFGDLKGKPGERFEPEVIAEMVDKIKVLGTEAYGNPREYLGTDFKENRELGIVKFTEAEEEEIADQIFNRLQGFEYALHTEEYDENTGKMVSVEYKPNKFSGLSKRSFRDIYDSMLYDIKKEGKEEQAINYANVKTEKGGIQSQEYRDVRTNQFFNNKDVRAKNKINIVAKIKTANEHLTNLKNAREKNERGDVHFDANLEKAIKDKEEEIKSYEGALKRNAEEYIPAHYGGVDNSKYYPARTIVHQELANRTFDNKGNWYNKAPGLSEETRVKLQETANTALENGLDQIKADQLSEIPSMSPQAYAEQLYDEAVYNMQFNDKIGNENFIELNLAPGGKYDWKTAWGIMMQNPKLRSRLEAAGIKPTKEFIAGQGLGEYGTEEGGFVKETIKLSFTELANAGLEIEDFEGSMDKLANTASVIGESNIRNFKTWFEARNENKAKAEGLYNLAFLNNDVSLMKRESGIITFGKTTLKALGSAYGDLSEEDAKKWGLERDVDITADFKEAVRSFNESEKVKSGEIAPLNLTPDQIEALKNTYAEDIGEGTGQFVPMLIELGLISWATGGFGGMGILKQHAWFNKMPKIMQHGVGMMVEEWKMQQFMKLPEGGGATFYALGTASSNLLFNKRFKFLKPLFDKVIKNGPVGAISMEAAGVTEAMYDELMGNRDFVAAMDELYGDVDDVTRRILVNSVVFGLTGVHTVKRGDLPFNATASAHLKGINANENGMKHTEQKVFTRTQEKREHLEKSQKDKTITEEGKPGEVTEEIKPPTIKEQIEKVHGEPEKEPTITPTEQDDETPEGYELAKGYTRDGISYGDLYVAIDGKGVTKPAGPTIQDYNAKYKADSKLDYTAKEKEQMKSYFSMRNNLKQQYLSSVYSWHLDPNNPKFEANFKKQFMEPMNQVLKNIDPKFSGIEVAMGKGDVWRNQNIKNGEKSTAEWQPDWVNAKGEKVGRIVMDLNAYTAGKPMHELTHAIVTRYMEVNPIAKSNFSNKIAEMFKDYNFGENPVFEGMTGKDLKDRIDDVYEEKNEEKRMEEFLAFTSEILGNPEVYYSHPDLASNLLSEIRLEIKDIMGEVGLVGWAPKNAAQVVEMLGLLGKSYRTGSSIKRKGKAYATLLGVDILGAENIIAKDKAESIKLSEEVPVKPRVVEEVMSSKDLTDLAKEYKKDPTKVDVEDLTDQYNRLALSALGYDIRKGDVPSSEAFSFVGKEFPSIMRRYDPTKKIKFSTWVTSNITPKRQEFYQEQIGEKAKQTSLDAEKARQYAGGETPLEVLEEKESVTTEKVQKQINPLDFTNVKGKQKEIEKAVDITPGDAVVLSVGGFKGVGERYAGEVGSKIFDIPADKITDPKKNLTYAKKIKNGIPEPSEAGNIQKAFTSVNEVERLFRLLPKESVSSTEAVISKQGERIDVSKDVQGRALGLSNRVQNYFYEKTGKRSKGTTSQPFIWKLKSKYKSPTTATIETFQSDLGITPKGELNKYDRNIGQLLKGAAKLESTLVANKIVRDKIESMDLKTAKAEKQILADIKAGAPDIMSSLNLNKTQRKGVEDMFNELENTDLGSVSKIKSIITDNKYRSIPAMIKEGIISKLNKQKVLEDIYEGIYEKASQEKIAAELSEIWGKKITPEQVRKIELKGETTWTGISKVIGIKNMNLAATSSKDYVARKKATDKAFIKYMIPKGKELKDLTAHQQSTIAKSIGEGDTRGTLGGRRTTKKEYAEELRKKLASEKRDTTVYEAGHKWEGVPKKATTADLLEVIYGKDVLKGTGPELPKGTEASFAPGSWGTFKHKVERFLDTNPSVKEIQDFVRDLLTGTEFGYDATMSANVNMLKRAYGSQVERFINNPTTRTLEDIAGLLQQQVNRALGAFKTYVPMHSVTTKTGDVSKIRKGKEVGKLHNEHETELLTMNRKFMDVLKQFKDKELTADQLRNYSDHMVERLKQSLITEQVRKYQKDKSGAAIADFVNKLLYLGKEGEFQVPLAESTTLVNMSEVLFNEMAQSEIAKLKNTNWNKLSELGVLAKQKAMNKANNIKLNEDNLKLTKEAQVSSSKDLTNGERLKKLKDRDEAMRRAGLIDKPVKKARVFDFDDTVARTSSKVFATKGNQKKTLTAEQFAKHGEKLVVEGWEMDFSDFNKVVKGKKGPLFNLMKTMKEAKGDRDIFILTARAQEAAPAIKKFLKEMGIDIPLENIKGLGDSSPYAKSDWILEKAAEGYNDFYFADDAKSNVKAVRDVLEQIDVKSQVQQALSSMNLNKDFNKILENKSGIEWYKEYSDAKAKVIGADKGKRKFFLPPTAEDFLGLLYPTLGKGKVGEKQMEWYQDNLLRPYSRATQNLSTDRINLMNDFKALKKQLEVPKELKKKNKSGFTNEQAVRVYLWDKTGQKVSGLSKKDLRELLDVINNDSKLKAFADQILETTKGDGYSEPGKDWLAGTITTDLINLLNTTKRSKYLEQWKQNVDIIFSKKNLNKLEAMYGPKYREALENILSRMKSGRNRTSTGNRLSDNVLDYINNAQGTIMFLNMRSALLQTISSANFINLSFNNPIKAGRAFANQPQYWKDFVELINSDYLVDRRKGLKLNISESEIANAAAGSSNKAKAAINYILEKGYLPTKIADSFAIASGGATWYRNRIKDLIKKEGLSEVEAKKKAFEEFRDISEVAQQSSDPSKISMQQASDLGRVVLQFVNTPMQYTRLQKRAFQDLKNKRGDWKSNISKILYYGVIQNLWFNAMQQGLFALGFGDDEISDKEEKKIYDTANGMADSILRGIGMGGMTVSVIKNTLLDIYERSGKSRPEYHDAWVNLLEFSPAIKSKMAKLRSAGWPFDSKKRRQEVFDKGFSLDNPAYESLAKVISAATNVPLDRLFTKYHNLENMVADDTEMWESVASFFGWPEWQLDEGVDKEAKEDSSKSNKKYTELKNSTSKKEQQEMLEKLGYSDAEIKNLKYEDDRVKAILKGKITKKKYSSSIKSSSGVNPAVPIKEAVSIK